MRSSSRKAESVDVAEQDAPAPPTPLLLITGFLGSGKTTLINRLLQLPGPPKLGVVVNEFGQIGIDGALLAGTEILELANGCVCCVKGTEMWESAHELVARAGAEVLLVETSGLVEPAVLLEQYALLPARLRERIDLRGILCLVDVPHVSEARTRRGEVDQQLRIADRLLLTKSDVSRPEELLAAHRLLDELGASSERASITPTTPAGEVKNLLRWALAAGATKRLPRRRTSGRSVANEKNESEPRSAPDPDHDHDHDHAGSAPCAGDDAGQTGRHGGRQLVAVSLHEPGPLLAAPLQRLLRELPGEVLRVKGLVRVLELAETGKPALALRVLHLAGRIVELAPPSAATATAAPAGSTLVFIGEDLDESWLRLRLSACRAGIQADSCIVRNEGLPTESAIDSQQTI